MTNVIRRRTTAQTPRTAAARTAIVAVFVVSVGLCAGCTTPVDPDDPFLSSTTSTPAE